MTRKPAGKIPPQLAAEDEELRARLEAAEDTLRALASGAVDAIVVPGVGGERIYALKSADLSYRKLIEEMSDGVAIVAADGIILSANRRFAEIARAPSGQVIGVAVTRWIAPDVQAALLQLLGKGDSRSYHAESVLTAGDGTAVPIRIAANRLGTADMPDCIGLVISDLTESRQRQRQEAENLGALARLEGQLSADAASRRELLSVIEDQTQAVEALRISAQRYQLLFDNSRDALMILEAPSWTFTGANQAAVQLFGASGVAEFTAVGPWDVSPAIQPDGQRSSEKARQIIETVRREGSLLYEWTFHRLDGTPFVADVLLTRMQLGETAFLQTTIRDVSERKAQERALQRVNRALRTHSAGDSVLVHASSERQIVQEICNVVVNEGGYKAAWVEFAEHDDARTLRPVAWAGADEDYIRRLDSTWADTERGRGMSGNCIRSGVRQVVRDIESDPSMAPWRDEAIKRGYKSSAAFPLIGSGGAFGVAVIIAGERDAFDSDELVLLSEMSTDLAYGLGALRTAEEQAQGLLRLERSMEGTVRALAGTVEARDPYTAGHQRRVAAVATAIAGELGMTDHAIHGLLLAATVHDIGKINIPAEILSKPGKLTALEFELVKTHAESGYQILKDVEFPWPVAEIVRQHHERLDGKGYPRGLIASQILPEAKVLAVADVVEAMSSYRPYRAGLGLDAALAEVEKMRGIAFDADAVDACLKLFREKGFKIPD